MSYETLKYMYIQYRRYTLMTPSSQEGVWQYYAKMATKYFEELKRIDADVPQFRRNSLRGNYP